MKIYVGYCCKLIYVVNGIFLGLFRSGKKFAYHDTSIGKMCNVLIKMLRNAWEYSMIYLDSLVMYTWHAPGLIIELVWTLSRKLLVWMRRSTARRVLCTYQAFCRSPTSKTIQDRYVVITALACSFHYITAGAHFVFFSLEIEP